MPRFLDTRGKSTLGIGVCARCGRKMSLDELRPDRNSPGLKVCDADNDEFDPWRLAAPPPDRITLPFVRPDFDIATHPGGLITEDGNMFLVTENFEEYLLP